jgi:single-strand DNA-binding protein
MGRLGKDPELRKTNSGTAVVTMSLATSQRRKSKDGDWTDHTEWHQVIVWAKRAENCAKYLNKGSQILVEGEIQTRKWEDNEGKNRYTTEINARDITFLQKSDSAGTSQREEASTSSEPAGPNYSEDDIPF